MCYCNINVLPSIYCVACGELYCVACVEKSNILKCDSCGSFYCNECGVELDCEHNYCSVNCVLENSNKKCIDKCFFFRDLYFNQSRESVIYYWTNKVYKEEIEDWIKEYDDKTK